MFHKGGGGKPKGFGFGGFSMGGRTREEKDEKPGLGASSLTGPGTTGNKFLPGRSFGYSTNIGKRRAKNEDE